MMIVELLFDDGRRRQVQFSLPALIGRHHSCQIHVSSWRVARQHARLVLKDSGVFLEDLGSLAGTTLNGLRVTEYGPLAMDDEILIGPCRIVVIDCPATVGSHAATVLPGMEERERGSDEETRTGPLRLAASAAIPATANACPDSTEVAHNKVGLAGSSAADVALPDTVHVDRYVAQEKAGESQAHQQRQHQRRIHARLLEALDLRRKDVSQMSDAALRAETDAILGQIIASDAHLPTDIDKKRLRQDVLNEAVGLGPLEPLMADPTVTEIMVNRHDEIFVEKAGKLVRYHGGFSSEQSVLGVIDRIVAPLGRRIDESSPMVDARLKDGSRVNAVIPPVALRGASLTIRKFPDFRPAMADLLRLGSLDEAMSQFLTLCIRHRKNIIVSGGTGSGKTTLLNILSNCIPSHERIITIEDAAELQLNHQHKVSLEARPANAEGRGVVQIRDLVRNALRMRPDRIVVGECRGAEAFDMLAAMNTGHEGSLTTLHANSPRDALARLETMILMAGMDLPLAAVREHIASSIDFIVQQSRLSCGRRVLTSITEICGMESGIIKSQEIYGFDRTGHGAFVGRGIVPDCFDVLRSIDASLDPGMFSSYSALAQDMSVYSFAEPAAMSLPGNKEGLQI